MDTNFNVNLVLTQPNSLSSSWNNPWPLSMCVCMCKCVSARLCTTDQPNIMTYTLFPNHWPLFLQPIDTFDQSISHIGLLDDWNLKKKREKKAGNHFSNNVTEKAYLTSFLKCYTKVIIKELHTYGHSHWNQRNAVGHLNLLLQMQTLAYPVSGVIWVFEHTLLKQIKSEVGHVHFMKSISFMWRWRWKKKRS